MTHLRNILIILFLLVISKNILFGIFTNNDELIIHGKISPYYSYTIKTYFKAQSSLPICYSFGSGILWGGSMFSKKTTRFLHEPKINEGTHTITIPLGYQGLNICDYKLDRVYLDVPQDNNLVLFEKYVDLEYVGYAKTSFYNRTSSVVPILKSQNGNNYNIDFYSYADYDTYSKQQIQREENHNALSRDTRKEQSQSYHLIYIDIKDSLKKMKYKAFYLKVTKCFI